MNELPDTPLFETIYQNMRTKPTSELIAIWRSDDRSAWSSETFAAIERLLVERLGELPEKKPLRRRRPGKRKEQEDAELSKLTLFMLIPWAILVVVVLLGFLVKPAAHERWYPWILDLSLFLSFAVTGVLMGWLAWFRGDQVKEKSAKNLPKLKESYGWFYRTFYFFIPDRHIPTYALWVARYMSIALIVASILVIKSLLDMQR